MEVFTNKGSDALEARLDQLLRRNAVEARGDFTARALARVRSEEAARDSALDRMLRRHVVSARADFTDRVLGRVAAGAVSTRTGVFHGARGWWAPVATAAALLMISIGFLAQPETAPPPSGSALAAHSSASLSEIASHPSIDPEMARLFALAEGLGSEARVLLDNPDVSSWLAMAE